MRHDRSVVPGPVVAVGDATLTPLLEVREISLTTRWGRWAVSTVRPKRVEVRDAAGTTSIVKIPDPRRFLGAAALLAALGLTTRRSTP
jgi:hypothetical protein